ncbi:vitellogenin-6-like [Tetranychus urticae]|uniref:Vitellogenin n=1 Tax=Tetranychus urticae TaxID=32264 RepID=T1L536_TETUR|nr:vitellogenin-6-like [Tetranychus urticae]
MKIFLSTLALLVVSACAGQLKPKPLEFEENKRYIYEYIGSVVTGIPSSSSLYSGTRLQANVEISHIVSENGVHLNAMRLSNISFTQVLDEITNPDDVHFGNLDNENSEKKKLLELTVQYHVNYVTKHFEWVEVDKMDEPWSLNIKKAIIEMFLVDIAGKQLKMNHNHEHDLTKHSRDEIHHSFDVYEPTSKGECETMYQVINALPETVSGLPGSEQFYWKVIKTRNYQNCNNASELTRHNWARNCAAHCKKAPILGQFKINNYYGAEKSECSCDAQDPLDQQSTSTYSIECMENPYILNAESNSKVIFDNHGTRFISYTNQTLRFVRISGAPLDRINENNAIRVSNLTFTLYPYAGSSAKVYTHEIPIYNLLTPISPQNEFIMFRLAHDTSNLLSQVAVTIIGKANENRLSVARFMTRIIQNLAHLDLKYIMKVYEENCIVQEDQLYTNALNSVRRQLFLDAISHVGTRNVVTWLEKVINATPDSNGLFPIEVRQVVETLPLNIHVPPTSLIDLLHKKIYSCIVQKDWDSLSAFVVAYGKLIAKACPNPGTSFIMKEEPESEECSVQDTFEYVVGLAMNLVRTQSMRGKLLIAQALAHSGKFISLLNLTPYAKGEFVCPGDVSECAFFRTTVIYSLHHMIPVEPKRVRSLVSTIFNTKTEPYEVRLAAFTVFMSTVPKRHELESVAVSLRNETNHQVITMVRSILEETANLTQACHQPLAQAAREIVATLPEINLDGVYSQASYNEWFSTDKSTGFFANGRFVANDVSYIPRHGYVIIGSHWKSLSNPWFSFAFQQKGLETALKHLKLATKTMARDPRKIDDLWEDLGVESRDEEEFMLQFFVRVYEQTSLFTMDKYTLKNAYNQFVRVMRNFVSDASKNQVDFNWVRFYMPSTYTDIVPTAIGLPIAAIKQNNQIVSLRLTKSDLKTSQTLGLTSGNIKFKVTPQTFTSSDFSLSVFNQGLEIEANYGVHNSKMFNFYVPLNLNFGWNLEDNKFTYAIKPVFDKTNFHSSNNNFAFTARSHVGLLTTQPIKAKRTIQSLVPAYNHPLVQFKSRELGMNLNLGLTTERPWFIDLTEIPCEGTVAWLLEKYNEMNQFNNNINLTLVQNEEYPASGFVGSFRHEQDIDGEYVAIGEINPSEETNARRIVQDLIQRYPSRINNPAFFARSIEFYLATFGHPEPTEFNSTLTLGTAIDNHAYWFRFNSTLDNKNEDLWTRVARKAIVDGKVERPVIPSDLLWRNPEDIKSPYIVYISWASDVKSEKLGSYIIVQGDLSRSARDPVIPEMERESWFHKQCKKDIKNGNATNHACERVIAEQAYFNLATGVIEWRGVQEPVRESIRKAYSELKRSLMYYWKPWSNISIERTEGEQDVVKFAAAYSNIIYKRPVISFFVQTPTEKVNFTKIFVPVALFPAMHPINYLKASQMPKDQTCTLMKDSIRTFDNVTYRTWLDECEFVASMDCSQNKQFAVTVKGKAGERSIRVYTPLQNYYKVYDVKKDSASLTVYDRFDQAQGDFVLKSGTPAMRLSMLSNSKYHEAHRVFIHDGVVNVVLPKENVRVAFDGHYLKITTSPLFVGKTCGLCGNQNQEFYSEFLDPKMVDLASNLTAFRDSYSLHNCIEPLPCSEPEQCESEDSLFVNHDRSTLFANRPINKKTSNPILQTLIINQKDSTCASLAPQKMCKEGQKASKTERKLVDMLCKSKSRSDVKKSVEKSTITKFNKTETLTYNSPVECVSDKESVRGL